jgi:hypothetical protein
MVCKIKEFIAGEEIQEFAEQWSLREKIPPLHQRV